MGSSIFSSEHISKRIIRFASALILLTILSGTLNLLVYFFYEKEFEDVQTEKKWQEKIKKNPIYPILLVGDSRTYRGINPEALEKKFHYPAYNAGLSSAGMNETMFRYFNENKLSPSSGFRMIILGITPHSMILEQRSNKHLNSLIKKAEQDSMFRFGGTDYSAVFFKPMNERRYKKLRRRIRNKEKEERPNLKNIWVNGWFSHDIKYHQKLFDDGLKKYRKRISSGKFSEDSLSDLCTWTRKWKNDGIIVIGFRPPTSSLMEEIENQLPGYKEQYLKKKFEDAGGIYLSFPKDAYQTYDASHLNKENAERFS